MELGSFKCLRYTSTGRAKEFNDSRDAHTCIHILTLCLGYGLCAFKSLGGWSRAICVPTGATNSVLHQDTTSLLVFTHVATCVIHIILSSKEYMYRTRTYYKQVLCICLGCISFLVNEAKRLGKPCNCVQPSSVGLFNHPLFVLCLVS